jgi:hypothetical protein
MEGVKSHVLKMIQLVSRRERMRNAEVGLILFKIERLLLWANESFDADTKFKNLQGSIPNGK